MLKIKQSIINKIAGMADRNLHCEALITLADVLESPEGKEQIEAISLMQERQGYLTPDQVEKRYRLYQRLMEKAKALLPEETYKSLYMAF